jgi:hypothetical protein
MANLEDLFDQLDDDIQHVLVEFDTRLAQPHTTNRDLRWRDDINSEDWEKFKTDVSMVIKRFKQKVCKTPYRTYQQ